jgi:hypothetical protein
MLYFQRNGIQFKIPIGKDAVYDHDLLERQIKCAMSALQALKDRSPGLDQMRYELPGQFTVSRNFGVDQITIVPQKTAGGRAAKEAKERVYGPNYVLLVEMGGGPSAFAIFAPSERGQEANTGDGSANLALAGWTDMVSDINLDPPGIVGQQTFRARWCAKVLVSGGPYPIDILPDDLEALAFESVEQVKRVDQGYLAYPGENDTEEVTQCGTYWNYWTYEDIPETEYHVYPGPPPPDLCGYTWSPPGDSSGEYHDLQHLFWYRFRGPAPQPDGSGGRIIDFWPVEFNQEYIYATHVRREGGVFRYIDYDRSEWDDAVDVGVMQACGEFLFANTFTNIVSRWENSHRYFGIVWGTYASPVDNIPSGSFPYAGFTNGPAYSEEVSSDFSRVWDLDGVYVKDDTNYFIQGLRRNTEGNWTDGTAGRLGEREARIPANMFDTPLVDAMTERQLTILEGNEGAAAFEYNPWTQIWEYEEQTDPERIERDVMINAGGREYFIFREQKLTATEFISSSFQDYGIFTKENTGVKKNNEVDAEKVDPIYAYSVLKVNESNQAKKIIYGMVLDGLHYRTEEFDGADGAYSVPGTENAPDPCTERVRIGIRKPKITIFDIKEVYDAEGR